MTEDELENYWNTLLSLSGKLENLEKERQKLLATIKYPKSLFRFRSVSENSLNALEENNMYFSSADYYDDPFDTYMRIDIPRLLKIVDDIKSDQSTLFLILNEIFPSLDFKNFSIQNLKLNLLVFSHDIKTLRRIMQEDSYSICFCENAENEVNWLKYADNHRGFVLEYNISQKFVDELWKCRGLSANLLPIYYSDQKYDATNYAIYEVLLHICRPTLELYKKIISYLDWENTKISVIKKRCHKFDEEWRIIPLFRLNSRDIIQWQPKSVTIGLRTPEYKKRLIISAAQIAGISEFYQMTINEHDEFVRVPLTV